MNSKKISSSENYKSQPAKFIIPQEKYKQMLYDILWVKKITKSNILWLLSQQESVKQKVEQICRKNWFTQDDLLERSRVWFRQEKRNENNILLRNGKRNLTNIENKSDEDIITEIKSLLDKEIKQYISDHVVKWPDGSINYTETMHNIEEYDNNKKAFAEAKIESEIKNKEKWKQIANTLSDYDFRLLDDMLTDALKKSDKLTQWSGWNSIESFLKRKFPEISKLFSKKAQIYFAHKYFPLYEDKYGNNWKELYPHDRNIVILPLSKNWKQICKIRWEREIIWLVAKKIDNWKVDLLSLVDTHINQQKVEMLIQQLINIYYETFYNVYIYNYNENNERRLIELDLEKIHLNYREFQWKNIWLLTSEQFNEKLLYNAQAILDIKLSKNSRTTHWEKSDYSNIPNFDWFSSILELYKEYFISCLYCTDTKNRIRKPWRREILEKFWFTIINKDWIPNRNKISIVTDTKKAS